MKRNFRKVSPSEIATNIVSLTEEIQEIKFKIENLKTLKRAYESSNKSRSLDLIKELTELYNKDIEKLKQKIEWENFKLESRIKNGKSDKDINWRKRIDLIKSNVPIEVEVRKRTKLRRSGGLLIGKCPICDYPGSFVVKPISSAFRCRECPSGGDIFDFVMAKEKLTFKEAVTYLFSRYI